MDKQEANIDILFRNGLKDYEVLPPREVWNNIRPVIRKRQRPVIFLRAAAMIAVILSLTLLAYRYSIRISAGLENIDLTVGRETDRPVINTTVAVNSPVIKIRNKMPVLADASTTETGSQNSDAVSENVIAIQNILYPTLTDRMPVNKRPGPGTINLSELYRNTPGAFSETENPTLYVPENTVEPTSQRWSIAALVSPTYYTRFGSGSDEVPSSMVSEEQPVISYAGGVAFSYKINKRFSVQSGLYYSSFGQELSGISTFGGFQRYDYTKGDPNFAVRTANGIVYTNNSDVFLLDNISENRISTRYTNDVFDPSKANLTYLDNSLRQNFSYLELPVILRYKLVDRTVDFNIIGGVSSNVLVNNSVYAALDGGKYQVGKTEGLNLISFSSSLGMGMEYSFSKNLSLNLEPTFRYYINPFSSFSGMRIHPYSFGIFSGVSYKF